MSQRPFDKALLPEKFSAALQMCRRARRYHSLLLALSLENNAIKELFAKKGW